MEKHHWNQLVALFNEGIDLPQAERESWLVSRCPDETLRDALRAMFDGDETLFDPGDQVREYIDELATPSPSPATLTGKRVGAWTLVEQIGAGGMGTVYLAERSSGDFRQQAALKLLNPAVLSPQTRLRFENERQILADLKHPNIAHLIDGGETDDGLPYLVMEYVEGTSIDAYCDRQNLDLKARCELMITICAAVQFAHNHLVVHRDLKPSNILVTDDGGVKLLDFGIAKLLRENVGLITQNPRSRPLTPLYASPEQQKGGAITTASDVYSLGVLMFRILSGEMPRRGDPTGSMPSKAPVTRPSGLTDRRALEGDLDNIVMMALREEPDRRYSSAAGLGNDIERYLRHEPVTARADAWSYRASRFIRRHRQPLALAAMMVFALAATTWVYTGRLAAERDRAEQESAKSRQVAAFLEDIFEKADPNNATSGELTATDLLDQGVESIAQQRLSDPALRGHLLQVMSSSYRNLDDFEKSRTTAEASIEALRKAVRTGDPSAEQELIRSLTGLGVVLRMQGQFEPAMAATQEAVSLVLKPGTHDEALEVWVSNNLGLLYKETGHYQEAQSYLERSLELSRNVYGEIHGETADAMNNLGVTYMQLGDYKLARYYLCGAAEIGEQALDTLNNNLAVFINNCGMALSRLGQFDAALERHNDSLRRRQALNGDDAFGTFFCYIAMTYALIETRRLDETGEQLARARRIMDLHLGPDSAVRARYYQALGSAHFARQHHALALEAYSEAHRINLDHLGEAHMGTQLNAVNLARTLLALGRPEQAVDLVGAADAYFARTIPPGNMLRYTLQLAKAELALTQDDRDTARHFYTSALQNCTQNVGENSHCVNEARQALDRLST